MSAKLPGDNPDQRRPCRTDDSHLYPTRDCPACQRRLAAEARAVLLESTRRRPGKGRLGKSFRQKWRGE